MFLEGLAHGASLDFTEVVALNIQHLHFALDVPSLIQCLEHFNASTKLLYAMPSDVYSGECRHGTHSKVSALIEP